MIGLGRKKRFWLKLVLAQASTQASAQAGIGVGTAWPGHAWWAFFGTRSYFQRNLMQMIADSLYSRKIGGPTSASRLAHVVCGPPKVLGMSDAKQFHSALQARDIRRLLVSNMSE